MAHQSNMHPELELRLVEVDLSDNEKKDASSSGIDIITQYRILDKKCDETLKRIHARRNKKN